MIEVACPECANVLKLPATFDVPPAGRLLSCTRCQSIWRLRPDSHKAVAAPVAPAAPPPDPAATSSAEAVPRSLLRRLAPAAAIALCALGLVAAGLLGLRDHLAVWLPGTRGVFTALGVHVKPSDLSVGLLGWNADPDGGWRIAYRISNQTALARRLPTICVDGRSDDDEVRFSRCFAAERGDLLPGAYVDASFLVLDAVGPSPTVMLRMQKPEG